MSIGLRQFHATLLVAPSAREGVRRTNVVVGKNYRLQNIQLSKIKPGVSPPDPRSLTRWGPEAQLRSLAGKSVSQHSSREKLLTSVRSEQPLAQRSLATSPTSVCARLIRPQCAHRNSFPPSPFELWRDRHECALSFPIFSPHRLACSPPSLLSFGGQP